MSKSYIAYLTGPITGLSFDGAVDWRDAFCKLIPPEIQGMSPLRGKHYLQGSESIAASYEDIVLSSARGITTRDYNDCKRSDVVIANLLGASKVSIGTVMEIAWTKAFQIPLIAIMEKEGNPHDHPMITECIGFRVENLEEAADIAKVILLPAPHRKED